MCGDEVANRRDEFRPERSGPIACMCGAVDDDQLEGGKHALELLLTAATRFPTPDERESPCVAGQRFFRRRPVGAVDTGANASVTAQRSQ